MTLLKDQEHMTTRREGGQIIKTAKDAEGVFHLSNETAFLATMAPSGYVAKLLDFRGTVEAPTAIILEDLGNTEEVTNTDELLTHAIHLLNWLRRSRIWHGDLTAPNLIIRDNKPYAIDFGESIDLDAPPTRHSKRPEADWFHLLQAVEAHGDPRRIIRRWLAMRDNFGEGHTLEDVRLVDFGSHMGYMPALAAADGAIGIGMDIDPNICVAAMNHWKDLNVEGFTAIFNHMDAMDWEPSLIEGMEGGVGLCLSLYPWLIQSHGEEAARLFLAKAVKAFDMLFFEAQSAGDGPGPAFWPDQQAVGEYLSVFGNVRPICRLDIGGRQAERVTWKVTEN